MSSRTTRGPTASTTANSRLVALTVFFGLGLASAAHAQTGQEPTTLSFDEFAGLVGNGLPADALVRAGVLDAEAESLRARALPPLGLKLERQEVFVDGEGVVLQNSVDLAWSVDVSGRRGLRIDAADARLRATRLRGERARALIASDAAAIYLRAARARRRLESLEKSREALAKLTGSLTRRAEEGDVSGADVTRFALALSRHDDRIASSEAETMAAEQRLAALLGRPGRIVASDTLALPRSPTRASDPDEATRPEVRAASEELAGGQALVQAASRWWVPNLEMSAGYLSTDFGPGTGPGADVAHGYLATLTLSLPVFSRGRAERKRGQARVARARAKKTLLERRIRAEVESAQTLLSSRIERARVHESKRLVLAAELVRKTEAAYEGGEATALELRDAHEELAEARLRAVELRYQARLAEQKLLRARGLEPNASSRGNSQ